MSMFWAQRYGTSAHNFDYRDVESLAALVGDSVARVADGQEPDAEDKAVLSSATRALREQAAMYEFIVNKTAASLPHMAIHGADALVDLIWAATEQLSFDGYPPSRTRDGLATLIGALESIASGDREQAQTYDNLFERVAVLAEEGVGDIYSSHFGRL